MNDYIREGMLFHVRIESIEPIPLDKKRVAFEVMDGPLEGKLIYMEIPEGE